MSLLTRVASLLLLVMMVALPDSASAHDARPVAITITETVPGLYRFSMLVPPTVAPSNLPDVVWPVSCTRLQQPDAIDSLMRCDGDLAGQQFSLKYPQFNPSLGTFFRLDRLDAGSTTAMLAPTQEAWTVPEAMTSLQVIKQYTLLGGEHIIGGYDHLLFVLGLLVIARTPRRILLTVTGFTLAHSITLSLSALGYVRVPIAPVEATIALSIVFLAHEISRQQFDSLTYRFPLLVAFGFGLLHGLGFASALGEIGLVREEAMLSLLFFNIGVEIGQLLFIATVAALVLTASRVLPVATRSLLVRRRTDLVAAYLIGIPSAYWLIDRVVQFGA
jgi:hypothetical protein